MATLTVEAEPRDGRGKGRARQLRRAGQVPAIAYGGASEPLAVSVDPRVVDKVLHSEAGHNAIFTLVVKGHGKTPAMIRDWQVDPVRGMLLHVDFLRIALDTRLKVKVPVEVRGEPIGVKQQGGILEVIQREIEVECLPADIPEKFLVDVSPLGINQAVRVGDLTVDHKKIRILTDAERVIVHVVPPKVEEEKPAEEAAVVAAVGAVAAEPVEPELIRKRKPEGEEEVAEETGKTPKASAEGEKKK